jgi:hypothetical protein
VVGVRGWLKRDRLFCESNGFVVPSRSPVRPGYATVARSPSRIQFKGTFDGRDRGIVMSTNGEDGAKSVVGIGQREIQFDGVPQCAGAPAAMGSQRRFIEGATTLKARTSCNARWPEG